MTYITVKITNAEAIIASLNDFGREQVPFAISLAANRLAKIAMNELYDEMKRVFDRPIAWTLNSLYIKAATKRTMQALLKLKDQAFKGIPPTKYLTPQIYGGSRNWKRHEKALQYRGILPRGMYAVPGDAAIIDGHGNMSKGQIIQILSALKAFSEVGYLANRTQRSSRINKNQPAYFGLREPHGRLLPGIYKRTKSGVKPVLIFVKEPSYSKRFDFFGVAERVIEQHAEEEFIKAIEHAKATAFNI